MGSDESVLGMSAGSSCSDGNRVQTIEEALEEPAVADHSHQPLLGDGDDLNGAPALMQPIEERHLLRNRQRGDIMEKKRSAARNRQVQLARQSAPIQRAARQGFEPTQDGFGGAIDAI